MTLHSLATAYKGRPSDFLTLRRAMPEDRTTLDQAVYLWAQAEAAMDHWHAQQQRS
ncbi:hypothetical protein L1280_002783 [Deinococcus sp. HSC-46F16]|uniref:hypothetical protein n=1 Tax=Deinococcus sp. HSC-46F16 TaxID=2910968 RepID=UPI0020A043DA|nr:hypothetical protein [Deinococcus sp. HSC-46F16]MCP2015615.1 hypothetical protein [Deinococcus sp. HSC-46F16]